MGSNTQKVGKASDVKFSDPTGQFMGQLDNLGSVAGGLQGYVDPEAYMEAFLGQSGNLANLVSGPNSALQESLNAIAKREADLGGEAALGSLGPGIRNSGAAMAAYGSAYADPFAKVASQIQQNQLEGTLGLWNNAMNNYGAQYQGLQDLYGDILGQQTAMAQGTGEMWSPTYMQKKNGFDYFMDFGNLGANVADAIIPG